MLRRAPKKNKTMCSTPDFQDASVRPNATKLLKLASYSMRSDQQTRTGIISGLEEVVRFVPLKLKHQLKRPLRPLVMLIDKKPLHL